MKAFIYGVVAAAGLSIGAVAGAQTQSPNGMTPPPGTQNKTSTTQPCTNLDTTGQPSNQAQMDTGCTGVGPGFASPGMNMSKPEGHAVTAVIRVNAAVEKPDKFPYPMDFQTVGDATMLKAKLPQVKACLGVAKSWTKRANAATSTTCIDHKGEVLAYQECKPADGAVPMVCSAAEPGQTETASTK